MAEDPSSWGAVPVDQNNPAAWGATPVEPTATAGSLAKQSVGLAGGLVNMLGSTADVLSGDIYMKPLTRKLFPNEPAVPTATESLKSTLSTVEANPDEIWAPQNPSERITRSAFEAVPWALTGGGEGLLAGSLIQAAAGAGGQAAAEMVPEKYKPYAQFAGSIAAGGAGAGTAALTRVGARAIADRSLPYRAGWGSKKAQEAGAAEVVGRAATDPEAAEQALAANPQEIVPGSKGTTAQVADDMGLLALERKYAMSNREEDRSFREQFNTQRAEQNRARVAAIDNLEANGDPRTVPAMLDAQLKDIDTVTQRAVDDAASQAQRQAEIGGTATPEAYGNTLRQMAQTAEDAARMTERNLWENIDPTGKMTVDVNPIKNSARAIANSMTESAKPMSGEEAAIFDVASQYRPIMPLRSLTDLRSRITTAMREEMLSSGMTPTYGRLSKMRSAIENSIYTTLEDQAARNPAFAARVKEVFNEWRSENLGSNAQTATGTGPAGVSGVSRPVRPATLGLGDDTRGARVQAPPPAEGNVRLYTANKFPGDTSAIPSRREQGWFTKDQSKADKYGEVQYIDIPNKHSGWMNFDLHGGINGPGDEYVTANEAMKNAARPLVERPTFDIGAAERLREATQATRERAQAFGSKPLGPILQRQGQQGPYKVSDALVPNKIFHPGPDGFEHVRAFREAVGDPNAMPLLQDYAAHSLRQAAMDADGTINPAKFAKWQQAHADALRAFPELNAKFADAAKATEAIGDVASIRKDALENAQRGVLGDLLGLKKPSDPSDISKTIGRIFGAKDGVSQMRDLVSQIKGAGRSEIPGVTPEMRQEAMKGLRQAVVDHVTGKLISNAEAGVSGVKQIKADQFQTFVKNNEQILRQIFSDDEVNSMKAVAADLTRANRSVIAAKYPGSPGTAHDLRPPKEGGPFHSLLSKILFGTGLHAVGAGLHTVFTVLGGVHLANKIREAGINKIDDLVKAGLQDPSIMRSLLQKVPKEQEANVGRILARRLANVSMYGGSTFLNRKTGGAVTQKKSFAPLKRADGGSAFEASGGVLSDNPENLVSPSSPETVTERVPGKFVAPIEYGWDQPIYRDQETGEPKAVDPERHITQWNPDTKRHEVYEATEQTRPYDWYRDSKLGQVVSGFGPMAAYQTAKSVATLPQDIVEGRIEPGDYSRAMDVAALTALHGSDIRTGPLGRGDTTVLPPRPAPVSAETMPRTIEHEPTVGDPYAIPAQEPQRALPAPEPAAGVGSVQGRPGGASGLEEAQRAAASAAEGATKLEGLPDQPVAIGDQWFVPGPVKVIQDIAQQYMKGAGLLYNPPTKYVRVDEGRAARIAQAFDEMPHAPDDPRVQESYNAMIDETVAQYQALKKLGLKIDFIPPGAEDPYALSPRLAQKDLVENGHLWVFPTDSGFGSGPEAAAAMKENPLLRPTGLVENGHPMLANDVFRIVHDIFGHFKDGVGFRASGEENAWRSHSAMYSDLARPAMTAETRGQNSWVNYGPHGETNRTASSANTVYAPQKIGRLPDWVVNEGRGDVLPEPRQRNLSYELDFGEGAPYNQTYPEWGGLTSQQKGAVGGEILPKIADFAKDVVGAGDLTQLSGLGGWHEFTNPAFKSRLVATPEQAGDLADIIGYLGQQTKIFGYHYNPYGEKIGVALHAPELGDPATVSKLWQRLVERHPDFAAGFSPSIDPNGVPGIEMLLDDGGEKMMKKVGTELIPALKRIADELGIKRIEANDFRATEESRAHDWKADPNGGDYLERLASRYGPEIQQRLELFKRQELEPALREEIARAGQEGQAPLRRQVLERGKSGRPIRTEPLNIGSENKILEAGLARNAIQPREVLPGLKSGLETALSDSKMEQGTAEQWMNHLRNLPGVKAEELKWVGTPDVKGQITKRQMQEWVRDHGVQLNEVTKGKGAYARRAELQALGDNRTLQQENELSDINEGTWEGEPTVNSGAPKYSQWQMPGGTNYGEKLFTLPVKMGPEGNAVAAFAKEMREKYGDRWLSLATEQEQRRYDDLIEAQERAPSQPETENYRSSHWDEPNVLAHVRYNDRTLPDGRKALHIEELQSDAHQTARREGYKIPEAEYQAKQDAFKSQLDDITREMSASPSPERQLELYKKQGEITDQYNALHDAQSFAVPDMPFKATWPDLLLKRMIREAASKGYAALSWTPGDVQADRYDLSKQVDRIMYSPETHDLWAHKGQSRVLNEENIKPEDLEKYIGKEAADKILNNPTDKYTSGNDIVHELSGNDLKVGGHGMKAFYDKMLVDKANALGKKYGAKVTQSPLHTQPPDYYAIKNEHGRYEIRDHVGNLVGSTDYSNRSSALNEIKDIVAKGAKQVHVLPITPALRNAAIKQGFPMFAAGGRVLARTHGGRVNPANINHKPTEGQKAANNYAHDHINIAGMSIAIENAKGSERSGVGPDGKRWIVKSMPSHYGYLKKTTASDSDHLDCFVGPHIKAPHVYVIDQIDANTGKYDEAKALICFANEAQAIRTYRNAFSDGKGADRIGHITTFTVPGFKEWLANGDTRKPIHRSLARAA